jgi:hypothetical protein
MNRYNIIMFYLWFVSKKEKFMKILKIVIFCIFLLILLSNVYKCLFIKPGDDIQFIKTAVIGLLIYQIKITDDKNKE